MNNEPSNGWAETTTLPASLATVLISVSPSLEIQTLYSVIADFITIAYSVSASRKTGVLNLNSVAAVASSDILIFSGGITTSEYGRILVVGVPSSVGRIWNTTGAEPFSAFAWKYTSTLEMNIPVRSLTVNVCAIGSSSLFSLGSLIIWVTWDTLVTLVTLVTFVTLLSILVILVISVTSWVTLVITSNPLTVWIVLDCASPPIDWVSWNWLFLTSAFLNDKVVSWVESISPWE